MGWGGVRLMETLIWCLPALLFGRKLPTSSFLDARQCSFSLYIHGSSQAVGLALELKESKSMPESMPKVSETSVLALEPWVEGSGVGLGSLLLHMWVLVQLLP